MNKTLKEIAEYLGGDLEGDGTLMITGVAGISEARPGQLSFVANDKYAALAKRSSAAALVVRRDLVLKGFNLVRVDDPAQAWDRVLDLVKPEPVPIPQGIDPRALVSPEAVLGRGVTVMAFAVIEAGAVLGDRTVIYPGVYVGYRCRVGQDCLLYPNVVLRERVELGNRVILHSGAVVGADGFGYSDESGRFRKQEQFGTVVIEDDVEVGANAAIDRARFDVTRIGRGTKIDNLVQIAHNVIIGENCIIISQSGIAGSARLGKGVILAGQVGVAGHITIGDHVRVAARSGVTKDMPDNLIVYGMPAGSLMEKKREAVGIRKIPEIIETVRHLSKRLSRLEAQSKND